ncbi:membrane protein [Spirochaetia bacterium]|nr:membrane protein [Spirochaetia bacterium]
MTEAITITNAELLPPLFALYRWGIAVIQHIQTIQSPGLTAFIKILTALGTEYFYLPVILFIFWCLDKKKGARLGMFIILSAFINGFFKELLKQPRPFNLEPSVGLAFEPSYGIPSGHAQLSLCFALSLALWYGRSAGIRIGAVLFVLLIALTRLYLGLHFPTDILAGWLLGLFTLVLWRVFEKRAVPLLNNLRIRMIAAAAAAIGMNALYPADRSLGGLFLGFTAGYALMLKYFPTGASDGVPLIVRLPRYLLGIAGGILIYQALKALPFLGAASPYYDLGRFVRYGLLGLWASAGAPWLFLRLRLVEQ